MKSLSRSHAPRLLLLAALVLAALPGLWSAMACGPFFYAAPPPLSDYPERFAVKTWEEIFLEEAPMAEEALPPDEMENAIGEVARAWLEGKHDRRTAGERLVELIEANRKGMYQVHFANLLHELGEILGTAEPREAREYVMWRVAELAEPMRVSPRPQDEEQLEEWRMVGEESAAFFEAALDEATPVMRPHWKVQRAAWRLARRELDAAAADVAKVLEDAATSGRGEVALLLAGRIDLVRSRALRRAARQAWRNPANDREVMAAAWAASGHFQEYLERWPDGRFVADVIGWQGALASDAGHWGEAITIHIRQLEAQPTREVRRAVHRECNMLFGRMLRDDEAVFGEWECRLIAESLARHPSLALGLVYHCLDTEVRADFQEYVIYENFSSDAGWLGFLRRRVVQPRAAALPLLEALAAAVVTEGGHREEEMDARALLVLAWVSSEQGEYARAAALLDRMPTQAASTDEVLDLRAHLARMQGRHEESLAALHDLAARHPESPLARDLPWREAQALWQGGRSGDAVKVLWKVRPDPHVYVPPEEVEPRLRSGFELDQMIDALLQFMPLAELLPLADAEDVELRQLARRILRGRAFAGGDFELAMSDLLLSDPLPDPDSFWPRFPGAPVLAGYLGRESLDLHAAPVAAARKAVESARPGAERARAKLALARAWWEARGYLAMPSVEAFYPSMSEPQITILRQRQNARHLGLTEEEASLELDRRDEAWHALHAALAAAEEDPSVAVAALALANECLFRMAELSWYQGQRAFETGAAELSSVWVERLRQDHPDAPETAAAIPLRFTSHPDRLGWMPGSATHWIAAGMLLEAVTEDERSAWRFSYRNDARTREWVGILEDIGRRLGKGELERAQARDELAEARASFLETYESLFDAWVLNHFDDLQSLLATERGDGDALSAYFVLRLGDEVPDARAAEWEDLRDFVHFLEVARRPGMETPESWSDFLDAYPDSPKSETADFRRIRLLCRAQRGTPVIVRQQWPDSIVPRAGRTVEIPRPGPVDPQPLLSAITLHQEMFDPPRYHNDLKLLEAGALDDAGESARALELIAAVLSDPAALDLHLDAVLLLASHGMRLVDPETRGATLAAFRESPDARGFLHRLISGQTILSRLRPMQDGL